MVKLQHEDAATDTSRPFCPHGQETDTDRFNNKFNQTYLCDF